MSIVEKIPVAIYARVSSEKQNETESIEHQISFLTEHMRRRLGDNCYTDETLLYVDEAISGFSKVLSEREAIQRMFHDAEKGLFKIALFKEISRMGRDNEELAKVPRIFESYGVRVVAVEDMYDSNQKDTKLMYGFLSVLAEKESERISTRVSSGNREKARSGKWATVAPLGYKINKDTGKLEEDVETSHIPKLIFDLYVNKRIGTTHIAQQLNEEGNFTSKGYVFEKAYVRGILKNQVYIGHVIYGKTRAKINRIYDENKNLVAKKKVLVPTNDPIVTYNAHEPIIDEYLFWKAQEIMTSRSRSSNGSSAAKHPLVGITSCSKCGGAIICQARSTRDYQYRYYKCSTNHRKGKAGCDSLNIVADTLEEQIYNILMDDLFNLVKNEHGSRGFVEENTLKEQLVKLDQEKKKRIKQQIQLSDERDLYTDETYKERMIFLRKQIESFENQITIAQNQINELQNRVSNITRLEELVNKYKNFDLQNKIELRALFHELIERIEIFDKDTISLIKYKHAI